MWGVAGRDSTGNRGQLVRRVMSFSGFRAGLFRVLRGPFFRPAGGWFVFPLSPTACEAGEKCDSELHHRAPAAEAGPIFHRVTVCLKAYPDTNREYSGIRIGSFPGYESGVGLDRNREFSWIRIESFPASCEALRLPKPGFIKTASGTTNSVLAFTGAKERWLLALGRLVGGVLIWGRRVAGRGRRRSEFSLRRSRLGLAVSCR